MMDATAIQVRIGELCHQFRLRTMMGRSRCPDSPPPGTVTPWRPSWKCWSRRPRTAGSAASAGCAPHPSCPPARPGRPSSTTVCPWLCGSNWASCLTAASSTAASTCWPSDCPAPARPMHCAPWATGWWKLDVRSSSPRPTGWCRTCSPSSATWRYGDNYESSTTAISCCWTDLGHLPQGAEESEVLFTLIAERYERRSLGITSNLVFSQWEHIFANPMATAAAIDRVVHHSVILEFDVPSYRTGVAQQLGREQEQPS